MESIEDNLMINKEEAMIEHEEDTPYEGNPLVMSNKRNSLM